MREVLGCFGKDWILTTLSGIYERLISDGLLIVQVPNAESSFLRRGRYGNFSHELALTSFSLSQLLYIFGFREVNAYGSYRK